jgi:hypothetical protein
VPDTKQPRTHSTEQEYSMRLLSVYFGAIALLVATVAIIRAFS